MSSAFSKSKNFFLQKKKVDYLFLPLVISIYTFLIFLWHHYNHALPQSDAITYLSDGFYHYRSFYEQGFIKGLIGLYLERGWRPQIFPVFSVPFLILFGSNPFNAVIGVSLLFGALLISYLYLILRISLTPIYAATLAFFIATHPFIFQYNLIFFSEVSYLPLLLATFYHLLKSEFFINRRQSLLAGIFAGFVTYIRPAEAIIFLPIALAPFIFIALRRKNFALKEVAISTNIALATGVILFYTTYLLPPHQIKYLLVLIFTIVAIKKFKSSYLAQNSFVVFVFAFFTTTLIYWLPSIPSLIEWSKAASFGYVIQSLQLPDDTLINFALKIFTTWQYLWLPLLLSLPLIFLPRNYKKVTTESIVILIAAFAPLLLLLLSYTISLNDHQITRRSLGMGLLLSVALTNLFFNKNLNYKLPSLVIVILLTFINLVSILHYSLFGQDKSINKSLDKIIAFYPETISLIHKNNILPLPQTKPIDPNILLANAIDKRIHLYDSKNYLNHFRSFVIAGPIANVPDLIDPFTTGFVSNHLNNNESKFYLGPIVVESQKDFYEALKEKNINFVIVQESKNFTEEMVEKEDNRGSYKFTAGILKEYRAGGKFKKLKLIDVIEVYDSKILIFQNPA